MSRGPTIQKNTLPLLHGLLLKLSREDSRIQSLPKYSYRYSQVVAHLR